MDSTFYKFSDFQGSMHILNGTLKFDKPSGFNDPFDCLPAKKSIENQDPRLKEKHLFYKGREPTISECIAYANKLSSPSYHKEKNEKLRVLSLTKSHKNILMWSHYTNQHTGACIELDLSSVIHNGADLYSDQFWQPQPVEYTLKRPEVDAFEKGVFVKEVCTKHEDWNYEEEYRVVRTTQTANFKTIYEFPVEKFIKRVILGCRITPKNEKEIIEKIRSINQQLSIEIEINKAKISDSKYELNLERIDLNSYTTKNDISTPDYSINLNSEQALSLKTYLEKNTLNDGEHLAVEQYGEEVKITRINRT